MSVVLFSIGMGVAVIFGALTLWECIKSPVQFGEHHWATRPLKQQAKRPALGTASAYLAFWGVAIALVIFILR
jgi:hypothetical protein